MNIMVNDNYNGISISTYIINSQKRKEDSFNLNKKLDGFTEFEVTVIETCDDKTADFGYWRNLVNAVFEADENNDDVIVICNENHEFTRAYSKNFLFTTIVNANKQGAAILLGGVEGFGHAVPLSENRFWIDSFTSCNFIVLYKKIFNKLLNYKFKKKDSVDKVLSEITSHKMILYPFISKAGCNKNLNRVIHTTTDQIIDRGKAAERRLEQIHAAYRKYIKIC